LYEQIYPNPQPHKSTKDKKHNRKKKRGGMKGKKIHHLALAHIIHAPHKACNFRFIESKWKGEK
jgi:energy-converting hydrogenase Eha subunit F